MTNPSQTAPPERHLWKSLCLGLTLCCLALVVCATFLLPWTLERLVLRAANDLGLSDSSLTIRHVGLSRMEIGPLNIGEELHADALHVDYTLPGLFQKRINSLHILGLQVSMDTRSGKTVIPGLPASSAPSDSSLQFPDLPDIESLRIDGIAAIQHQTGRQTLPFTLRGNINHPDTFALTLSISAGQVPTIHFQGTVLKHELRLTTSIPSFVLEDIAVLGSGLGLPVIQGKIAATASLTAGEHISPRISMELQNLKVPSLDLAQVDTMAANFSDSGILLSPLLLSRPWPLELRLHDILIDASTLSLRAKWDLTTALPGQKESLQLAGAIEIKGKETTETTPEILLTVLPATIHYDDTALRLDSLTFKALYSKDSFRGKISFRGNAKQSNFSVKDITLDLPLVWPPQHHAGQGLFKLNLLKGKTSLGRADLSLEQKKDRIHVAGSLTGTLLAVKADVSAEINLASPKATTFGLDITDQTLHLPGNLRALVPALETLSGSARISGRVSLDMSRGTPRLPATLKLYEAGISHETAKLSLDDGKLECSIPDLLVLRSEPAQRLQFSSLRLGNVLLTKGNITFQIEHARNILIEECSFSWAGGRIGTQAFRLDPERTDYTVVLYCDRVLLAQALEQLGFPQAQGRGAANGRIPLRYTNGSLSFDQGFLYSTPGENGVLRLKGTEMLTAGVSPDSPQYMQLDLAAEALKNYVYDWAKITMNTEDQDLVVSLQLDGKPMHPLPFIFDREVGGFARIHGNSPGSEFQGIRLDVNFRLPLNQLLQDQQLLQLLTNGG